MQAAQATARLGVAKCAAATVPLLAAGCGGSSPGVKGTGSSSGQAGVVIDAYRHAQPSTTAQAALRI
jgi:hypothetical protein